MKIPRNLSKFYRRVKKFKFLDFRDFNEIKNGLGLDQIVAQIETLASKLSGYRYVIFTPSGRAAIESILVSQKMEKDQEIITQAYGCFDVNEIINQHATIKFCDVNRNNLNFDLAQIKELVSKKTKAIMPINLYGLHSPSKSIISFCKQNNILLIDDFAHDLTRFNRKNNFCDVAVFSFSKGLAAPCGGLIMTNRIDLYESIKAISEVLFSKNKNVSNKFYISGAKIISKSENSKFGNIFGFLLTKIFNNKNYLRMPNRIESSVCLSQLRKIREISEEYRTKNEILSIKLKKIKEITLIKSENKDVPLRTLILFDRPMPIAKILERMYSEECFEPSLNYNGDYVKSLSLQPTNLKNSDYLKNHVIAFGAENLSTLDIDEMVSTIADLTKNY